MMMARSRCTGEKNGMANDDADTSSTKTHSDLEPSPAGPSQKSVDKSAAAVKRRLNILDEDNPTLESCNASWVKVISVGVNGKVLEGSRDVLLSYVSRGRRVKVNMNTLAYEMFFLTSVPGESYIDNNIDTENNHICGKTGMHLTPKNQRSFESKFITLIICTTGRWRKYVASYGKSPQVKMSQSRGNSPMTWFAFMPKSKHIPSVHVHDKNGKLKQKSDCTLPNLQRNLLQGASIITVSKNGTSTVYGQSVRVKGKSLLATDMRTYMYYTPPQRWKQIVRIFGSRASHKKLYDRNINMVIEEFDKWKYFLDSCWKQVHETPTSESTKNLNNYIKRGHRIKIVILASVITVEEPQVVFFKEMGPVYGQLLYNVDLKADTLTHVQQLVRSNYVTTKACFFRRRGCNVTHQAMSQNQVKWFVDTTPWLLLFHRAINGSIISGSLAQLRSAVRKGAQVRVGCILPGDFSQYSPAERIYIGSSNKVHATLNSYLKVVEVNVSLSTDSTYKFKDRSVWMHMVVSSDGRLVIVKVPESGRKHKKLKSMKVEAKWFIQH